jgi:hypothetical protein
MPSVVANRAPIQQRVHRSIVDIRLCATSRVGRQRTVLMPPGWRIRACRACASRGGTDSTAPPSRSCRISPCWIGGVFRAAHTWVRPGMSNRRHECPVAGGTDLDGGWTEFRNGCRRAWRCSREGVHDASTAELAVGLMIACQRGIDLAARDTPAGRWRHERRRSLADSRVVVVGWGGVGRAIGRRLAGFEVDVVPVARTARDGVLGTAELDGALARADIVVLALPLTVVTRGLVDARRLALLPDGCLLVNVSRGPVVATEALTAEVVGGRLGRAGRHRPRTTAAGAPVVAGARVLTPHIGGNSRRSRLAPRPWWRPNFGAGWTERRWWGP